MEGKSVSKLGRVMVMILVVGFCLLGSACSTLFKINEPISVEQLAGHWVHRDSNGHTTTLDLNEDLTMKLEHAPDQAFIRYPSILNLDGLDWKETHDWTGTWTTGFDGQANFSYISVALHGGPSGLMLITEKDDAAISIYKSVGDPDTGVEFSFTRK